MNGLTFFIEFIPLGCLHCHIQALLFALFLGVSLLILMGNLVMILVTRGESHLHIPMYFFRRYLSFLGICFSSVIMPKILQNFLFQKNSISLWGCITQSFVFLLFGCAEASLLSAMAYDHYAALCHPLLYTMDMNRPVCTAVVSEAWVMGFHPTHY